MPAWLNWFFENATNAAAGFWNVLAQMAPYLLFGFFMAGVLSALISPRLIERHLGRGRFLPTLKAALFGIPLPLCSCGVIPVGASLRKHGASKGATAAFLIATPQDGVDSIMVTFGLLGPLFAVFRVAAALVSGVVGGVLVDVVEGGRTEAAPSQPGCEDACCVPEKRGNRLVGMFVYGFWTLPKDLAKPLVVGLLLAGILTAAIPPGFIAERIGPDYYYAVMMGMLIVGIPLYVCATASVPIAAALVVAGISPGAALVFLMSGPATNAATITTLWRALGRRTAIIYLAVVMFMALASGLLMDSLFPGAGAGVRALAAEAGQSHGAEGEHGHAHSGDHPDGPGYHHDTGDHHDHASRWSFQLPGWVGHASAVVLLALLMAALAAPWFTKKEMPAVEAKHEKVYLSISGMTCSHCADNVKRALESVPGVEVAAVDLAHKKAMAGGQGIDVARLREAVESGGYTVTSIESEAGETGG